MADPCNQTTASAILSECGKYRYRLDRVWSGEHAQPFIMLNPSTADAEMDDPTIRRCIGFARREGRGGIIVVNLYGLRATNPAELKRADNPIGPLNDEYVREVANWTARANVPIICSWGAHAAPSRVDRIRRLIEHQGAHTVCLERTASGHPKHPLYIRGDQPLELYP